MSKYSYLPYALILALCACQSPVPRVRVVFESAAPTYQQPDFSRFAIKGQLRLPENIASENVKLRLEQADNLPIAQEIALDAQGRFAIVDLPVGPDQHLRAFSILSDGTHFETRVPLNPQTPNLDLGSLLLQETGSITGVVTGESAGVTVFIPGTNYLAITDNDGAFILPNLPAGSYHLRAHKAQTLSETQTITVETGQVSTARLAFSAMPLAESTPTAAQKQLAGVVHTRDDQPVSEVVVLVLGTQLTAVTNAQGQFSLLIPSESQPVSLHFFYPDYQSQVRSIDPTLQTPLDVILQVKPATQSNGKIQGQLLDDQKQPITGARIETVPATRKSTSDTEGQYQLDVPPGSYLLRVYNEAGDLVASQTISIDPNQTIRPGLEGKLLYGQAAFCQQENTNNISIHAPGADVKVNVNNQNHCQIE